MFWSTAVLATSGIAPLVANKSYQPKLSYVKQENKDDTLPIANVGNWDLSTGIGYFKYLAWAIRYTQGNQTIWNWDNYDKVGDMFARDFDNLFGIGDNWLNSKIKIISDSAFVNESDIKKVNIKNNILDESQNYLTNSDNVSLNEMTSGYSHQESKGHSISTTTSEKFNFAGTANILNISFDFQFSQTNEWNDIVTDTYSVSPQSFNVPPRSVREVDYQLIEKIETLNNAFIWGTINPDQEFDVGIRQKSSDWQMYDKLFYKFSEWISLIKKYNLNWILNIPNAFLKQQDGTIMAKLSPVNVILISTVFNENVLPPKPLS